MWCFIYFTHGAITWRWINLFSILCTLNDSYILCILYIQYKVFLTKGFLGVDGIMHASMLHLMQGDASLYFSKSKTNLYVIAMLRSFLYMLWLYIFLYITTLLHVQGVLFTERVWLNYSGKIKYICSHTLCFFFCSDVLSAVVLIAPFEMLRLNGCGMNAVSWMCRTFYPV